MKPTLVIMAAGIGSRFGGLKQIEPVGPHGEIIMDYSIYDAIKSGFGKVVFIIKKEIDESFREIIGDKIAKIIDVEYVYQEVDNLPDGFSAPEGRTKPWGTGHAVLSCKDCVDTPFVVINADDFYGRSSFEIVADFLNNVKDNADFYNYAMVGFELSKTISENGHVARGVCESTADGFLKSIVERTNIQKFDDEIKYLEENGDFTPLKTDTIVSMNTWGFTPSIFAELERLFPIFLEKNKENLKAEFFLPTVVDELIQAKKANVKILHSKEKWFGVTYKEDKETVVNAINEFIKNDIYPENLWKEYLG